MLMNKTETEGKKDTSTYDTHRENIQTVYKKVSMRPRSRFGKAVPREGRGSLQTEENSLGDLMREQTESRLVHYLPFGRVW
jgi:hypothetical protein